MIDGWNAEDGEVTVDGVVVRLTRAEADVFGCLWKQIPHWTDSKRLEAALSFRRSHEDMKVYIRRLRVKGIPIEGRTGWGWRIAQ